MKITTRTVGDVQILDCSGKITLGEGTMAVRNTVRDMLKNSDPRACECFEELKEALSGAGLLEPRRDGAAWKWGGELAELERAVVSFEFESAIPVLLRLARVLDIALEE